MVAHGPETAATPDDLSTVTRLEIIDQNGRQYVNMHIAEMVLAFQDNGRTLKIFVRDQREKPTPPREV